ncbi:peptidoglycan-binding protein [Bradyrhizobium sp. 138]|uniref:peptidoglycan-binding domain-containing protein n=1 Tax=Bradyrhizobium sp. 138 TaxID=2782615 RepID=UPI001FF716EC|nr:peptidoglycan-binding domain-containing protein [Bradyrhizobium sp. 138]MCK1732628.1 peptidoglycan-binding protein [Bradyrhizobium sp. 138]
MSIIFSKPYFLFAAIAACKNPVDRRAFAVLGGLFLSCWIHGAAAQSLSERQVRDVQEALIWTTEYDGLIDGKLGEGTRQAIGNFQKRTSSSPTGQLSPQELDRLLAEGTQIRDQQFGFKQYTDTDVGVSVGIPFALLGKSGKTKWGRHWDNSLVSIDLLRFGTEVSLKDLHDRLISINGRTVAYDRLVENDWFVISAFENGAAVYVRANLVHFPDQPAEIRGFSIWMSKDRPKSYQAIAPAMLSSFRSNYDKNTDVSNYPIGRAPAQGGPVAPVPALPPNPISNRALDSSGPAIQVGRCYRGLGECPPILSAFR